MIKAHRAKIVSLLLVLCTLLVYAQVSQFDFVNYDDPQYVADNPYVIDGLSTTGLAWAFTEFEESNWHPVTWLSHMLDVQLFGLDPGPHHLVNLFLHIINALLLLHILRVMTGSLWRSALVAALFALHPLHVESVAWIAERKDVLSTCFWMVSILFYVRYVKAPSLARYLAVFAAMALGLMSKPMVVTLPFVLLLLDYWPLRRPASRALESRLNRAAIESAWPLLREKIPLFALAAGSCVVTFQAQKQGGSMTPSDMLDFGTRLGNAALAYGGYLLDTLFPAKLAVFYPYPDPFPLPKSIIISLLLAGATYGVFRLRKKLPYLAVGWLWYVGTLIPVIGLVQVGSQAMADRYTYIPLVGIFIILAWGFADLVARYPEVRAAALAALTTLLALMAAATHAQIGHWRDGVSLFERALAVAGRSLVVHNNLGQALAINGQTQEAIEHFQMALELKPRNPVARTNLGNALFDQNRIEEAIDQYLVALRFDPHAAETHNRLGLAYERLGDEGKAVYQYQRALRYKPDLGEALHNLGTLYYNAGQYGQAIEHYRKVLHRNPFSVETLNNLGLAYEKSGSRNWAIKHYRQAIDLNPGFAQAHGNLGVAYFRDGQLENAIEHLQTALELDPDYQVARENLERAMALWEAQQKS